MKPRRLKRVLASLNSVLPGMIPQKQGTTQFNGSRKRGSIVAFAISGTNVSIGVGVLVIESVEVSFIVAVVDIRVGVGTIGVDVRVIIRDGVCIICVGCIVVPADTHPAKANIEIIEIGIACSNFISKSFLIDSGMPGR